MSDKRTKLPQPPIWAANAVPTSRGWVDARTGSLLVAQRGLLEAYEELGVAVPRKSRRFEKRYGDRLSGEERRLYRAQGYTVTALTTKDDIAAQQRDRELRVKAEAAMTASTPEYKEKEPVRSTTELLTGDDLVDAYKVPDAEAPKPRAVDNSNEYQVDIHVPNVMVQVEENSLQAEVKEGFDIDGADALELEQYARDNHSYELDRRYAVRKLRGQVHALEEGKSHEEVTAMVKSKKKKKK